MSISDTERVRGRDGDVAPLIRYHGTSMEAYDGILKEGLRPTRRMGMVGNDLYYFGHYLKALRYSFQDSGREAGLRTSPVLLRYALFLRPTEVLRTVKDRSVYGTLETRPLTEADIASIPEKNRGFITQSEEKKKYSMSLYGKDTENVGPFRVLVRDKPFATWDEARQALFVGD